jgi:hypothetical protein
MKVMRKNFVTMIVVILLALSLACSLAPRLGDQTVAPKSVEATETSVMPVPSPTMTPRPMPSPTPTAASPVCVTSGQVAPLANVSFDAYPAAILDYLNSGATPDQLETALVDAAVANRPVAVLDADLNADGKLDLAVSIFNPASSLVTPESTLLVYLCEANEYTLAFQQTEDTGAILWHFRDLDADGMAELIFSRSQCGAHTCFETYHILSWSPGGIQDTVLEGSNELPYPVLELQDPDGDRRFDILITGSGFGSVGAGPQRPKTVVYAYIPEQSGWARYDTILGKSNYRIHVLQDAEIAARDGDYTAATDLYQRVIEDPNLLDWVSPEEERADLSAYAEFKLVVMHTALDQPDRAKESFNRMGESIAASAPQSGYVDLAQTFLSAYDTSGLQAGCSAVESYAEANVEAILLPLNSFGYGNPGYTAADLCPYR